MTLIEILVVLVLIGIVLGIVGGNFIGKGEKAKADAAKIEISQIAQTLDLYKLEIGRYPTTQEGLQALITAPSGVDQLERALLEEISRCRRIPGATSTSTCRRPQNAPYEIISLGADGKEGGEGPNKDLVELAVMSLARAAIRRNRLAGGCAASAGVTLLELLIVLSIMALVSALVLPMFGSGVSTGELKAAARQVAAGLRLARSEALATRQETRVMLDLERRTFQTEPERASTRCRADRAQAVHGAERSRQRAAGAIRFFPDGGSNGGRITLAVGERKYDVDVDWLSGRVAILD